MAGIGQYFKDTHGELRHVAWPTQIQTVVYTVLVALISIFVAIYLGIFDFAFTSAVKHLVGVTPATEQRQEVVPDVVESAPQIEFGVGNVETNQ